VLTVACRTFAFSTLIKIFSVVHSTLSGQFSAMHIVCQKDDCMNEGLFAAGEVDDDGVFLPPVRKRKLEIVIDPETSEAAPATVAYCPGHADEELKCGICLGTIDRTWAVTACIHRFCSDCLHRSLRMELGSQKMNHECPLCRVKIPSRRSTKPDPTFDALIGILVGYDRAGSSVEPSSRATAQEGPDEDNNDDDDNAMPQGGGGGGVRTRREERTRIDVSAFRKVHEENVRKFRQQAANMRNSLLQNLAGAPQRGTGGMYPQQLHSPGAGSSTAASAAITTIPTTTTAATAAAASASSPMPFRDERQPSDTAEQRRQMQGMANQGHDYVQWSLEPLGGLGAGSERRGGTGGPGRHSASHAFASRSEQFKLDKPYLRSSATLTVSQVKAYLSQKLVLALSSDAVGAGSTSSTSNTSSVGTSGGQVGLDTAMTTQDATESGKVIAAAAAAAAAAVRTSRSIKVFTRKYPSNAVSYLFSEQKPLFMSNLTHPCFINFVRLLSWQTM